MAFSNSFGNDRAPGAGVTAVLGPTNTGKTHLAIERMLAHSSGVIGLPLRLLAREVYNKIVDRAGAESVALITGEEKIKPKNPRFWVSTVEAMPRDLDVSFLAVDEIQIAADLERGHVFTDRILHRRGRDETLLLGAATMRPIIERLVPGASISSDPHRRRCRARPCLNRSHPAPARPRRDAALGRRHHAPDHRAAVAGRLDQLGPTSPPMSSAAMSQPIASCTGAAATRRCSWAPPPCARSSSGCCRAPR